MDISSVSHPKPSTRPHESTSLVTSVKVSWLQPRTPEVCFGNIPDFDYLTCSVIKTIDHDLHYYHFYGNNVNHGQWLL